jgi:hypothetical protein
MNKFVGIDIFKETFDIYFGQEGKGCHVKLQQTDGCKVMAKAHMAFGRVS